VIRKQFKDLNEISKPSASTKPKKQYPLTRPYFERTEYLRNGGWKVRLPNAPWVLVDVDGTLAYAKNRHQHDESRVLTDVVHEAIAELVRELYPHYNICIVSGRHDWCGDDTCDWLDMQGIPYDHILMRYSGDNRSDVLAKQEILDELAAVIGKENIAFVIDDRPRVIEMWQSNGLVVRQAFDGQILTTPPTFKHAAGCPYNERKGYRRCPDCEALEYF
jgi:hypothetical protein